MKIENGIHIFEVGDTLPTVNAILEGQPTESRFGYLIVESHGKLIWRLATENDFRNSEAQRLQIKPEDVSIDYKGPQPCVNTGPMACSVSYCGPGHGFCQLTYNPSTGHYYCICR